MKERRASQKLSSKSIMDPNQNVKCKIVVVGDSQCGKTALLHVFAKDCFPEVSVAGPAWRGAACGVPPSPSTDSRLELSLLWILLLLLHYSFFLFEVVFLAPCYFPPGRPAGKGKVRWKRVGLGRASTLGC
jgi:GTPase SAR1 family protein